MEDHLYQYLLMLGDNSMIVGHRLSELCGHGPSLETDIALTNISLDLFGEVRSYFQYAAKVKGGEVTEDSIAFLRYERQYVNALLVEQPNTDFAHIIVRQFFYDAYHLPLLEQLMNSEDETIAAIAAKSVKESRYHLRFSSEWMKRLGAGTEESHYKMQAAVDHLFPFVDELYHETPVEAAMKQKGTGADLHTIREISRRTLDEVLTEATLVPTEVIPRQAEGKKGIHSEHMGYILSDFQYMQRTYPNMQW